MVLTGSAGVVKGSLVMDANLAGFTFIKTGGVLAAGNYSVTLNSGANAFNDGDPLDGNNDGTPGDAYTATFTVGAASSATVGITDLV